jgi:hypothetical protein
MNSNLAIVNLSPDFIADLIERGDYSFQEVKSLLESYGQQRVLQEVIDTYLAHTMERLSELTQAEFR